MADNRMWLVHIPSGRAILLGKRYSDWGVGNSPVTMEQYFEFINSNTAIEDRDEFALAFEDETDRSGRGFPKEWIYTDWEPLGNGAKGAKPMRLLTRGGCG